MTALLQFGSFKSHSGLTLPFKIECDAFTPDDWATLAQIANQRLYWGEVEGVPEGGLAFAEALRRYSQPDGRLMIVDDVFTTGQSMEEHRAGRDAFGLVVFARNLVPLWIEPMFELGPSFRS